MSAAALGLQTDRALWEEMATALRADLAQWEEEEAAVLAEITAEIADRIWAAQKAEKTLLSRIREVTGGRMLRPGSADTAQDWRESVPAHYRRMRDGVPADEVATELGFESEAALLAACRAEAGHLYHSHAETWAAAEWQAAQDPRYLAWLTEHQPEREALEDDLTTLEAWLAGADPSAHGPAGGAHAHHEGLDDAHRGGGTVGRESGYDPPTAPAAPIPAGGSAEERRDLARDRRRDGRRLGRRRRGGGRTMSPCPRCAAVAPRNAVVCPRCGYLLTAPPPPDPAAPALAMPQPAGSTPTVPPRVLAQARRSGGASRKPWGWWGAGLAAAVLLGTALGWDVYLGQVQQIGAAWRQLNADAKALAHQESATRATTAPPADLPAPVASQLAGYHDIITGTVPPGGTVMFPVTLIGPAGRVQTTAMVDTGNELPPILVEHLAEQIGLTPTGETTVMGVVPGASTTGPTYGAFDVVPQGHYVEGTPSALPIAQAVGVTQSTSGAGINLGQTVLAHTKLVEQDGRWWFGWNGSATPNSPSPAPPTPTPSAPPPTASPPSVSTPPTGWSTVMYQADGYTVTAAVPSAWTAEPLSTNGGGVMGMSWNARWPAIGSLQIDWVPANPQTMVPIRTTGPWGPSSQEGEVFTSGGLATQIFYDLLPDGHMFLIQVDVPASETSLIGRVVETIHIQPQ